MYNNNIANFDLREECRLRVLENMSMRRILRPRDENGEYRRLLNEKRHSLYLPLILVRVIKSRILRWAGHVTRLEEGRSTSIILNC